jgi:hypothetical protein
MGNGHLFVFNKNVHNPHIFLPGIPMFGIIFQITTAASGAATMYEIEFCQQKQSAVII